MISLVDLFIALLFGVSVAAIARLEHRRDDRHRAIAWTMGGMCTFVVIGSLVLDRDASALVRASGTAIALGMLPLIARLLYRDGIDLIDAVVSAFAGFVMGATSWNIAWKVMLSAAVVAGVFATVALLRKDDQTTRVSFGYILASLAFAATAFGVFSA